MSPKKRAAELSPISLDKLFSPLKRFRHLALAVSGGIDSIALMLLAAEWKGPTKFSVLTVDHGLRAQSAREAKLVVKWARDLGLKAHLLAWKEKKPTSAIQARAREARYRLMAQWCAQNDADGVVTAHTLDDQAETLLMRLARGSGIDGLSAMAGEITLYGVRVLRPLLHIPRRRLEQFLKERGQAFIDDPSNANPAFERIRIRQAREQLAELGLKPEALALAARRLGRARQALEKATDELEARVVDVQAQGHAIIELAQFQSAAEEIRLRLLARLLERIGGASPPPQLKEVERLSDWLTGSLGRARTLGGCRVQRRSGSLIIGRESGRMSGEPVRIEPGETLVWDDRFKIRLGRAGGKSLVILPLGKTKDAAQVKRPKEVPNFVFKTLPALIRDGQVALVPHIGYRGAGFSGLKAEVMPLSRHLIIH
jgi:tRNA(Ile)-lysidine synthase